MDQPADNGRSPFRPLRLVLGVLLVLLGISFAGQWYARHVSLPRYCEDPTSTLERVRHLLTEERPAGEGARRPYLIAAKLLFLVPRRSDEPREEYLLRLRRYLEQKCPSAA